jgi:hypothetical protein
MVGVGIKEVMFEEQCHPRPTEWQLLTRVNLGTVVGHSNGGLCIPSPRRKKGKVGKAEPSNKINICLTVTIPCTARSPH